MKKFFLLSLLVLISLCQAGIHSNPTLYQRAKSVARKALKSRATPYILGGIALTALPYKVLFRQTMKNYVWDSGSSYASKWLPGPMGIFIDEWRHARQMEQMQLRFSYGLIGAAVAMILMQEVGDGNQQPMVVNKIIVHNDGARQLVEKLEDETNSINY